MNSVIIHNAYNKEGNSVWKLKHKFKYQIDLGQVFQPV